MNYEQILDTSTPFTEQKLNLLDQIVMIFYNTTNNNEVNLDYFLNFVIKN